MEETKLPDIDSEDSEEDFVDNEMIEDEHCKMITFLI